MNSGEGMDTYGDVRRALEDTRTARGASNDPTIWPEWLKLLLATLSVIVTVTLAYAALDKRISLVDQKLDLKLDGITWQLQQLKAGRP